MTPQTPHSRLLVTTEEMRRLDQRTIEGHGVPAVALMESAGRAVAEIVKQLDHSGLVAIVCGPGSNGGDGYVAARLLRNAGRDVIAVRAVPEDRYTGAAEIAYRAAVKSGVPMVECLDESAQSDLAPLLGAARVVVDALLGTGQSRPLSGHFAQLVSLCNESRAIRVAIDVPSGIDADLGAARSTCFLADHTIALGFCKPGLVSLPAALAAGVVHVVDIGISEPLAREAGVRSLLLDASCLAPLRAPREATSHKGTFGHVLCIAGSPGKSGAALLAGAAVLRAGAGLCTVAAPPATAQAIEGRVPELMIVGVATAAELAPLLVDKRVVLIGPGLPEGELGAALLTATLAATAAARQTLVLDADALNHLARQPGLWRDRHGAPVVMTPHPGEAARLLNTTTVEINANRIASARELARRFASIVVLKGARTVIADERGRIAVNLSGNPALATGGTGDVLAGLAAGLLAQGDDPFLAVSRAVHLHGAAGDHVARQRGNSLLASDLLDAVSALLAS